MKTPQELEAAGFTDSGARRYDASMEAYSAALFSKSVALGDRDKADDAPREVTHEHVRSAAAAIEMKGSDRTDPVKVWCQAGEYICAGLAGVGGGSLSKPIGIAVFGISLAVGLVLFVIRSTRSRNQ